MTLPLIDAATVSRFMRFSRTELDWQYRQETRTITELQAEGVAATWNILAREPVALLADEVGMGKTMQALGVVALTWLRKPKARILVVAPNQSVADNWKTEFTAFLRQHWRHDDNLVRSEIDGGPVNAPMVCGTLREVVDAFSGGISRFVITKLTTFSHLGSGDGSRSDRQKRKEAQEAAVSLREELLGALGESLDLVVLDEAHGLRNVHGGSQRVEAVRTFFGGHDAPLGLKTLLLTATPNHTTNRDVASLLSYFQDAKEIPDSSEACLRRYAVRRLRLLDSCSKAHYREETAKACSFEGDEAAELFFTLYQKGLAELESEDGVPLFTNEKRSFLYGYLEGFESAQGEGGASDAQDELERNDYRNAEDSRLLAELSGAWRGRIGEAPRHPKYDRTVENLVPDPKAHWQRDGRRPEEDKTLVFVRRIPSCRELAARVNEGYDALLLEKLLEALGKPAGMSRDLLKAPSLREPLDALIKGAVSSGNEETDEGEEDGEASRSGSGFRPSKVMDWFRKGPEGDVPYTQGFLFRGRFQKVKELYPLFFEPPFRPDRPELPAPDGPLKDCRRWIQAVRLATDGFDPDQARMLRGHWGAGKRGDRASTGEGTIPTLASIFHRHLRAQDNAAWEAMQDEPACVREAFFNGFLRKGLLLASGAVVELYGWFLRAQRSTGSGSMYVKFCHQVDAGFPDSLTQALMGQALAGFREVSEKLTGRYGDKEILDYGWNELNGHDPAAYCSGEVADRSRLITSFNTPFFPDVLVATSVLQEGVNLHLNCRRVLHYGIAWTPGDNEQRVGRVDRLGSTVHRNLRRGEEDRLLIGYPYLAGTFDEDQLGQFIVRKHAAEKVLDRGETITSDRSIDASRSEANWQTWLRLPQPRDGALVPDPYPYHPTEPSPEWHEEARRLPSLQEHVEGLLRAALPGMGFVAELHGSSSRCRWFVEPKLSGEAGREHQPVEVRIVCHDALSSLHENPVFLLQMATPLFDALPEGIEPLLVKIGREHPLVQVCHDPELAGCWKVQARCCLPLVLHRDALDDCSPDEVAYCLGQLIAAGEMLERSLQPGQDLSLDMVSEERVHLPRSFLSTFSEPANAVVRPGAGWSLRGDVVSLPVTGGSFGLATSLEHQARMPFLFRDFSLDDAWELRFPAFDLQEGEQVLLERWGRRIELEHGSRFVDEDE